MRWWERMRMLGKTPSDADERADDKAALGDLKDSFERVRTRTDRLENELRRINSNLRRAKGKDA